MSHEEFLNHLSEILEMSAGELKGTMKLADLEGLTSIAMIGFLAFADEHFNKTLSPRQFAACETVDDLAKLVGIAV